ncbi:hypothetical protein FNW52_09475 [Flavobacterium sp. ZT3R18]|uniref:hypothetical protein n=1 Tax=Flavobacterium sp. ZT3R18 TaxID=2594429 RepID=UPI00117AED31|nr:hypothetical protein [Flavobacterium sp. ZT3R18]TRX35713.1 hypothetical protein FNW52_09475 [Flavobacterium sp. ZT3R18]
MKKSPEINVFYWALIISANTMGETAGDLISQTFNLGYGGGTIALISIFMLALIFALFSKNQPVFLYWIVITLASTTGTTISDYITRTLSLGYIHGTIVLVFLLALTFVIWRLFSKSSLIQNGFSKATEFLYWIAFLTSSILGTAFGDLLAHETSLGFGGGTVLLFILLLITVLIAFFTKISREICYWSAIILTHPIGATIGDYLTKHEGLNLGNSNASLVLVLVFLIVIITGKLMIIKKKHLLTSKRLSSFLTQ